MSLKEFFDSITAGGVVSFLVIILSLVEITPIKVSPLAWIGKRVNKATLDKVEEIDKKLDEHVAQSYRSKILNFQGKLLEKGIANHSQEEWREIINACEAYEVYIRNNHLNNGMCEMAIEYIKESYKECLKTRAFANIPGVKK